MSETSLNTFESRPELLNACMPRRPTDTHEGTPLHVEVPEIAVQSSFSPDLLTDTGLAVSPPALPLPVNHSLEGVSVQSPPSYSSASRLALLSHPAPSCGATLEIQHPEGSVSARPPVGGLASHLGSPAAASGEPLLGPQQDPTACRHSLPLSTSGSAPSPSPIDLGLPASQVSARAPPSGYPNPDTSLLPRALLQRSGLSAQSILRGSSTRIFLDLFSGFEKPLSAAVLLKHHPVVSTDILLDSSMDILNDAFLHFPT